MNSGFKFSYNNSLVDLSDVFAESTWFLPRGLWLWGSNSYGQLGDNSTTSRSSPVQIMSSDKTWANFSQGYSHAAGIKFDGTLWLWGRNNAGQLGTNSVINRSSPVQTVAGGNNWRSVSCGSSMTMGIKTDGTLWLWGGNTGGALGDSSSVTARSSPVQTVASGNNWVQGDVKYSTCAAIKSDGTLWTWGTNNPYGPLGDNTTINRSSPIQTIAGGSDWVKVLVDNLGITALKTDGSLWAMGDNTTGLIDQTNLNNKSSPVQVFATGPWVDFVRFNSTIFAIKNDGSLWGWGSSLLGDNTTRSRSSPVQTAAGGNNWKYLNYRYGAARAVKTDGTLWSWGQNQTTGAVGDNTTVNRSSPVQIGVDTSWFNADGIKGDVDY